MKVGCGGDIGEKGEKGQAGVKSGTHGGSLGDRNTLEWKFGGLVGLEKKASPIRNLHVRIRGLRAVGGDESYQVNDGDVFLFVMISLCILMEICEECCW